MAEIEKEEVESPACHLVAREEAISKFHYLHLSAVLRGLHNFVAKVAIHLHLVPSK